MKRNKKIIWISHGSTLNGAERVLLEGVKGLNNLNYEVSVVFPYNGELLKKCAKYNYLIITEHLPIDLTNIPNIDKVPDAGIRYYNGSGVYLDKEPFNKTIQEILVTYPEDHPHSKIVTYQVFLK